MVSDQKSRKALLDCGNPLPLWRNGLVSLFVLWENQMAGKGEGSLFDLTHLLGKPA